MPKSTVDVRRLSLKCLAAVTCLALLALGPSACRRGSYEAVCRLLDDGRLDDALDKAATSAPAERVLVAAALARWADQRKRTDTENIVGAARAYLAALALDPVKPEVYESLAVLVAEFPELNEPDHLFADKAAAAAGASLRDHPQLNEDPVFVRARRLLGAAANPQRPDTLAALAPSEGLAAAPSEVLLDCCIEPGLYIKQVHGAAGGWVALTARRGREEVGCVVSASDGAVKWWLDGCDQMSLSPGGRWVAWVKEAARGSPQELFVLDTETGVSRSLFTAELLAFDAAWSPDESRLAVSSPEGLILVGVDGSDRRILAGPVTWDGLPRVPARPQWIAAGSFVATQLMPESESTQYAEADPIRLFNPDTGATQPVRVDPITWYLSTALWSPDGSRVACLLATIETARWLQVVDPKATVWPTNSSPSARLGHGPSPGRPTPPRCCCSWGPRITPIAGASGCGNAKPAPCRWSAATSAAALSGATTGPSGGLA